MIIVKPQFGVLSAVFLCLSLRRKELSRYDMVCRLMNEIIVVYSLSSKKAVYAPKRSHATQHGVPSDGHAVHRRNICCYSCYRLRLE